MKNQNSRKIWLTIWGSLLLISLSLVAYNWVQGQRIEAEVGEVARTQARSLQGQPDISSLENQQRMQMEVVILQQSMLKNKRSRLILILSCIVFGVITIFAYMRMKTAEKEIDPQSLIDEIGSNP
jgi:uncharacterized membrane protein (DUF106 family)